MPTRKTSASDALVHTWLEQFTSREPDLVAVREAVQSAAASMDQDQTASLERLVEGWLQTYEQRGGLRGTLRQPEADGARWAAAAMAPQLCAALDSLATPFPGAADLVSAQRDLADLEVRQAAVMGDLEGAVRSNDVETVMRLRVDAQVELPRQVHAARGRVLELQAQAAEVVIAPTQARAEEFRQRAEQAQQERIAAYEQLEHAQAWMNVSRVIETNARELASAAEVEPERLREQLAAHEREADEDHERRMRALAGMSPEAVSA